MFCPTNSEAVREEIYLNEIEINRFEVRGCFLVWQRGMEREQVVYETNDLTMAQIVADLCVSCGGDQSFDFAVIWDVWTNREVVIDLARAA